MRLKAEQSPALLRRSETYPEAFNGRVPRRVRMLKTVTTDPVLARASGAVLVAECGKFYDVLVNVHGAVSVILGGGQLGLKPGDFEVTEWHPRAKHKRVRAEAKVTAERRDRPDATQAHVPHQVRRKLGVRANDVLIFDEGCDAAVQDAAVQGTYFVLRLKRDRRASPAPPAAVADPAPVTAEPAAPADSLAAAVRRKLDEQREGKRP